MNFVYIQNLSILQILTIKLKICIYIQNFVLKDPPGSPIFTLPATTRIFTLPTTTTIKTQLNNIRVSNQKKIAREKR